MAVAFSRPLTVARQEDLALLQKANIALRNFARQDYGGIEPDNVMHQRAYSALRTTKQRVSPQDFLNYIATASSSAGNTAEVIQDFWAAPRINFPASRRNSRPICYALISAKV